jgi:outer membrane protein
MNLFQKPYFIGLKSDNCLIFIYRRLKPTAKKHTKTPYMLFEMLPLIIFTIFLSINLNLPAQEKPSVNLRQAIDKAIENNHLLKIREYQIDEKQAKVAESRIKGLPSIIANSTWQYNQNLGNLTIEQGEFGVLPLSQQLIVPLPSSQLNFPLSKHNTFNAGVTIYQPITQLAKIKAGVDVSKTEFQISEEEKEKSIFLISQAVEKLYYGLLITGKQIEEAEAKSELAEMKLQDAESALKSGKTIETSIAGLMAGKADEEQNLIKLRFQEEDFMADFCVLTGLSTGQFRIEPVDLTTSADSLNVIPDDPVNVNSDIKLARLTQTKAEQAVKAAQWTYLPDLGLIAGYTYQKGNKIFPEQNPFVGATLKWNLQDLLLNRQLVNQRRSQFLQSQEQVALIEKQVATEVEKTSRKLIHARSLMATARKVLFYRTEELRIEQDKAKNGLNTPSGVINAKAMLAKAEASLLSSCLNYRMVITELEMLFRRK